MSKQIEQKKADLDAEIDSYWNKVTGYNPPFVVLELKKKDLAKVARHFAEWGVKRFREQIAAELTKFKWDPMKHLKK